MIKVRVRFFAALREITGKELIEVDVSSGTTAGALLDGLVADHPKLGPFSRVIHVAINKDFAIRETVLQADDEIAFLPPVSGG